MLKIGDVVFAVPIYYHLALLAIAASLGFFFYTQDGHRFAVWSGMLVTAILLPFAVRMYRTRLQYDDMTLWRSGKDDLALLYAGASLIVLLELLRSILLPSPLRTSIALLVQAGVLLAAILIIVESTLLGGTGRLQILAVLAPIMLLYSQCPPILY